MPSLFPYLFAFRELAPLLLRIVLGVIFFGQGYKRLFKEEKAQPAKVWAPIIGAIELFGGLLFLMGFLTQLVSIFLLFDAAVKIIRGSRKQEGEQDSMESRDFWFLVAATLLALLVLGPGAYSIDFPF